MKQPLDPRSVPYGTVEGWLWHLGLLCAGSMPSDEAAMRIAEFADMLRPRISPGSLCRDSCGHVAERCTFFPSFAEVARHLAEWCRDHAPREQRHTTPLPSPPPAERITPDQAAEILATHGWKRRGENLVPPFATAAERAPVTPRYVTGEALTEARRRAGIHVPPRSAVP